VVDTAALFTTEAHLEQRQVDPQVVGVEVLVAADVLKGALVCRWLGEGAAAAPAAAAVLGLLK
jgi:hypothetical protein